MVNTLHQCFRTHTHTHTPREAKRRNGVTGGFPLFLSSGLKQGSAKAEPPPWRFRGPDKRQRTPKQIFATRHRPNPRLGLSLDLRGLQRPPGATSSPPVKVLCH